MKSTKAAVQSAKAAVQSAKAAVESAKTAVESAKTAVESTKAPVKAADAPVKAAEPPMKSPKAAAVEASNASRTELGWRHRKEKCCEHGERGASVHGDLRPTRNAMAPSVTVVETSAPRQNR
jgi:hypothetical protein